MIIQPKNKNNINNYDTIIDKTENFFYYSNYLKPKFKINLLRKELMKNIKKISVMHIDNHHYAFIKKC